MEHSQRKEYVLWRQEGAPMLLLGKISVLISALLRSFLICSKQIYFYVNLEEVIGDIVVPFLELFSDILRFYC